MQVLVNGLIMGSIYGVVALSFSVVFRATRFLNFAHAGVYTVSGYCAWSLVKAQMPRTFAILIAVAAGIILGCLTELLVYRHMRRRAASNLALLLASLGLYVVIQNAVSLIWGDDTKVMSSTLIAEGYRVAGGRITAQQIIIVCACLAMAFLLALLMQTRYGTTFRALASDSELAVVVGVRPDRVILFVFAIGSGLAATASILVGYELFLAPTMGFKILVMAVIGVVIGGIESVWGAAVGALLVGVAQNAVVWYMPTKWLDGLAFVVFVLVLALRPQGVFARGVTHNAR